MFQKLQDRIGNAVKNITGRGKISESNIQEAINEVKNSLIEADVNLDVINILIDRIKNESLGQNVSSSLKPGEEFVGIVHKELVKIMGDDNTQIEFNSSSPTVIMMCGLQGTGKTTTCSKLASWFQGENKKVLLVACDLQRPAAVEQLSVLTQKINAEKKINTHDVGFYGEPELCTEYSDTDSVKNTESLNVATRSLRFAKENKFDVVIIDTAGRLHINDNLMDEVNQIHSKTNPKYTWLVVDSMAGQDAVSSASAFNKKLPLNGIILSKFDSDTRGGAVLSVKYVTSVPIRYIGTGEHIRDLEPFHPERTAGRILGMGDVVSLVEKAQKEISEKEASELAERMAKGEFSFEDFSKQIKSIRRMGSLKQIMGMMPGVGKALKNTDFDESQFDRIEAVISSMTPAERKQPSLLNKSRIKRIASGSGQQTNEVNQLKKQVDMFGKMSKQMSRGGMAQAAQALQSGALPSMSTKGSTKTKSRKQKFKKRR